MIWRDKPSFSGNRPQLRVETHHRFANSGVRIIDLAGIQVLVSGAIVVGTALSLLSFVFLYILVAYCERDRQPISAARFTLAMVIPFVASSAVGFSSPILGSAALAGWLAVATRFVLTYLALWKIVALPSTLSLAYTAAAVAFNVIVQSLWFYWLVNIAN